MRPWRSQRPATATGMTDSVVDPRAAALSARQPRAIHNALQVLEAVAELGAGVTARELSQRLGLPRATTYRLVHLLVEDEYLVRTPDLSGFALGAKVAQLAHAIAPRPIPTAARHLITAARGALRGGVHVVAFAGDRVQILDEDPDFPLRDPVRLAREPEHFAAGMLLRVANGDAGSAVATARAELEELGGIRRIDDGPGLSCLAVPIRAGDGTIAGAIAFTGARHRIEDPTRVLAPLVTLARQVASYIT